jgi:hypothetical protein
MLIIYGIYAFDNPDVSRNAGNHCYATDLPNVALSNITPVSADTLGAIDVSE